MKNTLTTLFLVGILLYSGLSYSACDEALVTFSTIVYDDWKNPSQPLPSGWDYYTALPADLQNGGYYAQSYIGCSNFGTKNYEYCEVAIANRGTTLSITDIYEDFLVLLELTPNYYHNAKDYLNFIIKKMITDGIYTEGKVDITGHSLGAVIAELLYTEIPPGHKAFARVFDSPGSKKILTNMVNSGILPKNALADSTYGIVRFYSPPNAINTTNEQIINPSEYQMNVMTEFPTEDFSNMNLETISTPTYLYYFKDYSLNQHKIINFYNYCFFYKGLNYEKIDPIEWPIGFLDSYKYYLTDNVYNNFDYWYHYLKYAWDNSPTFKIMFDNDEGSFDDTFYEMLKNSLSEKNILNDKFLNFNENTTDEFNIPDSKSSLLRSLATKSNFAKIVNNNLTGNSEMVRLIYNNASIDKKLYYSVLTDDLYLAEKLLKDGNANPNSLHGDKRYNLLQISVIMGYLDMVKLLLKYHANPNLQNTDGETVLHTVSHERYSDSGDYAKTLVEGGVISNIKNKNGKTALMVMQKHCEDCVQEFSKYV